MKVEYHVLSGAIGASLLIPVLGANSAVFFASSVLIDGDHYLDYIYRNRFKNFSIKGMFKFHDLINKQEKKQKVIYLNILHTVEFILLVYLASAATGWLWLKAALWGILFHMIFDWVNLYREGRLFQRAISLVEYFIRWRRLKRQGFHPDAAYHLALRDMSLGPDSPQDEAGKAEQ